MRSELEQEFFRVFGIEPKKLFSARQGINPDAVIYPEITAKKLLEMICIYNSVWFSGFATYSIFNARNIEELKEQIIRNCLKIKYDIKPQIQQLFKEDNQ